ncbi:hypothetical protein [Ancylobacter rudongensis]|nr:hypothetical protein [Ancylobacter rudongensis]
MKHLKIVDGAWAGYTGILGRFEFVEGVSVLKLHRCDRDLLASVANFVELEDDGGETPAGVTHRLATEAQLRAPVAAPLARQTETDKKAEAIMAAAAANKAPTEFHTKPELEAVADKSGIKGLRAIGDKWNVKSRSIPILIEMILDAQAKFILKRDQRMQSEPAPATEPAPVETPASAPAAEVEEDFTEAQIETTEVSLEEAAATGNLAAAISDDGQE